MKPASVDYLIVIGFWFLALLFFAAAREPSKYPYEPENICTSAYSC